MKTSIIVSLILVFNINYSLAQDSLCCNSIYLTKTVTTDCCVEATIHYPECDTAPTVIFEELSLADSTYSVGAIITGDPNSSVSWVYCPLDTFQIAAFRIRVVNPADTSQLICDTIVSKYAGEIVDLSNCCPCLLNLDDLVNITTMPDTSECDNFGCYVSIAWSIPTDSIAGCYQYFVFEDMDSNRTGMLNVETYPLSNHNFCLPAGESGSFKIFLITDGDPRDTCVIERTVECPECVCPPDKNDWLTYSLRKTTSCPNNGCKVQMNFDFPDDGSASCFTNYIFEGIDNAQSPAMSVANDPISGFNFCIDGDATGTFKVYLLTGQVPPDTCVLEQTVFCDTLTDYWPDSIPAPCYTDCTDDSWTIEEPITCSVDGCYFSITYSSRDACGVWQDVQILGIETLNTACWYVAPKDIFQAAMKCIIEENDMNFKPNADSLGCYDIWRFSSPACWQYGRTVAYPSYRPCDSADCCRQRMKVCRDSSGNVSIEPIGEGYSTDSIDCPTWEDLYESFQPDSNIMDECWSICNWFNYLLTYPKIATGEKPYDPLTFRDVVVGMDRRKAMFWVTTPEKGEINIDIFDLRGNKILSKTRPISGYETVIDIDMGPYVRGVYFYKVDINNGQLGSGKFIVK